MTSPGIHFYPSPTRNGLVELFKAPHQDILLACPFITASEIDWILSRLSHHNSVSSRLRLLTAIRLDHVLAGSLEIPGLTAILDFSASNAVINLPRLHAKVYLADSDFALVTSGNLTTSGLDLNYEYGIGITTSSDVEKIRSDIEQYARLGSAMSRAHLQRLESAAAAVRGEFDQEKRDYDRRVRKKLGDALRDTEEEFLRAQVGQRSAHSLFSQAIEFVLQSGPLTTPEIHARIQRLFPDLCDDSRELIINGQAFGKKWKHKVRTAQAHLKKQGVIDLRQTRWFLCGSD